MMQTLANRLSGVSQTLCLGGGLEYSQAGADKDTSQYALLGYGGAKLPEQGEGLDI